MFAGWVSNSTDPYQLPHSALSDLGLQCLIRPICPNKHRSLKSQSEMHVKMAQTDYLIRPAKAFCSPYRVVPLGHFNMHF